MWTREQEAGGEAEGSSGSEWKGPKGKRTGPGRDAGERVWGRLGAASAETLRDPLGRTRGSRRETASQSVGWMRGTEGRSGTNSWRRTEKEAAGRGARAPSSETGDEGQSGPSLRPWGGERIQMKPAVGIGARTPREEMRQEERSRECEKPGQSWWGQELSTRGLIGKFQGGMGYHSDILTCKFRILEYLFAFFRLLKGQ